MLLNLLKSFSFLAIIFLFLGTAVQGNNDDHLLNIYQTLHQKPELAFQEKNTSKLIATELKKLGYEVTEHVGGYGVVGILKNGLGPTILLRADMDALPVKEETNLPYASKIRMKDNNGQEIGLMHACGHDVHTTVLIGTAEELIKQKANWKGTLILVAQPAEEIGAGAKRMIQDGLFTRFPKPDYALALHVDATLPAGKLGVVEGYAMANVEDFDIIVHGIGGHGGSPHLTKDPIVLTAQIILGLQTIISRETPPGEPAVITIGAVNGGTKSNVIPDQVVLKVNVRSYSDEMRFKLLDSIKRITSNQARAAGIPENLLPTFTTDQDFAPALWNEPNLTKKVKEIFITKFGTENVIDKKPALAGEDFGHFGRTSEKIPICFFWLGAVDPIQYQQSKDNKTNLPTLHSSKFAPSANSTIKTGVQAMTTAVLNLAPTK
jgi:amidohydrolase